MPMYSPARAQEMQPLCMRRQSGPCFAATALLGILIFPFTAAFALQTSSPTPTSQTPSHPHKRKLAKPSPAVPVSQAAPAPAAPVTPPPPDWPANDKPSAATVVWDSQGLRIDASNSSLQQILHDVSTDTGIKVEGLHSDERIFGTYGPGQAGVVLSQLLDGTGYNVLMVGDQGEGTPRQVVLSAPPTGPAPMNNSRNTSSQEDFEAEQEAPPMEPPNLREGFQPPGAPGQPNAPGMPPRTPQQIIQQMQQMQQEQQQQQQNQSNPR